MIDLRRREFITLTGGAAACAFRPLAARAQQSERVRRIGVLMYLAADDAEGQARLAAFTQALQQLGWSDGRNIRIDTRWGVNDVDRDTDSFSSHTACARRSSVSADQFANATPRVGQCYCPSPFFVVVTAAGK